MKGLSLSFLAKRVVMVFAVTPEEVRRLSNADLLKQFASHVRDGVYIPHLHEEMSKMLEAELLRRLKPTEEALTKKKAPHPRKAKLVK